MNQESFVADSYDGGVIVIDSGFVRPLMAACYLVECGERAIVVETGTNHSVPRILATLNQRGWDPGQVSDVVVTHVHLDHAGGAGQLMQELPEASLRVHPRGARHMVDPARLEASARSVYGDDLFDRMYGHLVPVDAARVVEMNDGDGLKIGAREFVFRDTPGHARHHFCVWDSETRGWFTGDTFGLAYRELITSNGPFIFPTTTPIEFDPDAACASVALLMEKEPECAYLTHFGRVTDLRPLAQRLCAGIRWLAETAQRYADADDPAGEISHAIRRWLVSEVREHGVDLPDAELAAVLGPDIQLNTQGLCVWLKRRASEFHK